MRLRSITWECPGPRGACPVLHRVVAGQRSCGWHEGHHVRAKIPDRSTTDSNLGKSVHHNGTHNKADKLILLNFNYVTEMQLVLHGPTCLDILNSHGIRADPQQQH